MRAGQAATTAATPGTLTSAGQRGDGCHVVDRPGHARVGIEEPVRVGCQRIPDLDGAAADVLLVGRIGGQPGPLHGQQQRPAGPEHAIGRLGLTRESPCPSGGFDGGHGVAHGREGLGVTRCGRLRGGQSGQDVREEVALRERPLHALRRAVGQRSPQVRDLLLANLGADAHGAHPDHPRSGTKSQDDE
jgi:hypothetical protein